MQSLSLEKVTFLTCFSLSILKGLVNYKIANLYEELKATTFLTSFSLTHRLRTDDVLPSQLTHIPPGDASVPAEPDHFGSLGVPAFSHQYSELTHERPGLSFLCYQLAHGATFNGLTGDGLRPQCQPTGRATLKDTRLHGCFFFL